MKIFDPKRIPELLLCVVLTLVVTSAIVWVFFNKIAGVQEQPLVDATGHVQPVGVKLNVVGAKGDSITATKIVLVDIDGKETLTFHAGPPPTIELTDSRGNRKVIDLAKLASNRLLFEPRPE